MDVKQPSGGVSCFCYTTHGVFDTYKNSHDFLSPRTNKNSLNETKETQIHRKTTIHAFEKRSNGPGDRRRLTPPTNATRGFPLDVSPFSSCRCRHACFNATSDDEQAVSTVMLGPTVPRVKERRLASMDEAAPVLLKHTA